MTATEAMTTSPITTKTLASTTTTPAIPPPAFLAHVVLQTSTTNFDAMVHFYTTILSAQHTHTSPTAAFMTYDEEHHRLAILAAPDVKPRDPKTSGLRHIAFSYNTLADLVVGYKGRKAAGFEPVWCVDHGISTSMYYEDPDGNRVECQVDNMCKEEAIRYMASETFKKNPLGVDYQPEELVKRFESGEPWVGFLNRSVQEERDFGEHK